MNAPAKPQTPLPVDKDTGEPLSPVYRRRISAKVKVAIRARIREGLTWSQAAERAGMSAAGIHKARNQPHVHAYFEQEKANYINEVEALRAPHKARAFEVGRQLMDSAKSESVRARMVEFFAGEGKAGSSVQVNIQNNQTVTGSSGDYAFVRPGQQVVRIEGQGDTQYPADQGQVIDGKAETPDGNSCE